MGGTISLRQPGVGVEDYYRVERRKHGVVVFGAIPIPDFDALVRVWKKEGLTQLDAGISNAIRATFVVVSKKSGKAWHAEIEKSLAGHDAEAAWIAGADTGTSSKTIFSVLSEKYGAGAFRFDEAPYVPLDPSDFGRCHRLLKKIPGWRERLGEVAAKHPEWRRLVDAWDEVERLYLSELESGNAPKTYARIKELIGEPPPAARAAAADRGGV